MSTTNKPILGKGIYAIAELAKLLQLPYDRVNRWISQYWDGELGKAFNTQYSWKSGASKAVNFQTLIELYVMMTFTEAGVKTREVLKAHQTLSKWYQNPSPLALREVIQSIHTDGKKIYIRKGDDMITLDGSHQLNMDFIHLFFKKLEFDAESLAVKYWPMGKDRNIVVDPERKLGHAVIASHNIYPETLYSHYIAGDPIPYLAHIYHLTETEVKDAIDYCKAA